MFAHARLQALVGTARPDAAMTFYHRILGLTLKSEDQFAFVFAVGEADLRLTKLPAVIPSPHPVVAFAVNDLDAVLAGLAEAQVRLERFPMLPHDERGVWTSPDGARVIWFRDPDLNLLSAVQYR